MRLPAATALNMDKVRIGIIGMDNIGKHHAGYLLNGDGRALALADRGEQLMVKLAREDANAKSGSIAGLSDSTLR